MPLNDLHVRGILDLLLGLHPCGGLLQRKTTVRDLTSSARRVSVLRARYLLVPVPQLAHNRRIRVVKNV